MNGLTTDAYVCYISCPLVHCQIAFPPRPPPPGLCFICPFWLGVLLPATIIRGHSIMVIISHPTRRSLLFFNTPLCFPKVQKMHYKWDFKCLKERNNFYVLEHTLRVRSIWKKAPLHNYRVRKVWHSQLIRSELNLYIAPLPASWSQKPAIGLHVIKR
jgi:hypothetical protein